MTRASFGLLLALGMLGGCSRGTPQLPPVPESPQHQACRREARLSPQVRAYDRQVNPSMAQVGGRVELEKFMVERRAFHDCLRRAGLALPGGVEPVVPRDFGIDPILR